jgi:ABC-type glutathione transport system ATPase component
MKVRLAFAVAAHLEPDILIIDEVLAVGDAEFQKKAIGKMQDISNEGGRTVLFVSHNMAAVKSLCTRGVVLENGLLKFNGAVDKALDVYSNINKRKEYKVDFNKNTVRKGSSGILFKSLEIKNQDDKGTQDYSIGDDLNIVFSLENKTKEKSSEVGIQIRASDSMPVFHIMARDSNYVLTHRLETETYKVSVKDIRLFPGIYSIDLTCSNTTGHEVFDIIENALTFEIIDGGNFTTRKLPRAAGLIFLNPEWNKI